MLVYKSVVFLLFLYWLFGGIHKVSAKQDSLYNTKEAVLIDKLEQAKGMSRQFPDESILLFEECQDYYSHFRDTNGVISTLHHISDIQKENTRYSLAFDNLWESLYLSKESDNIPMQAVSYRRLAYLYEIYEMDSTCIALLNNSLELVKRSELDEKEKLTQLNFTYISLAFQYRRLKLFSKAIEYLDSCRLEYGYGKKKEVFTPFAYGERGLIYFEDGVLDSAQYYLSKAVELNEFYNLDYKILVYYYYGNLKKKLAQNDSAIYYYNMSLQTMKAINRLDEIKPKVLLQLSEIYQEQGKMTKAFSLLHLSISIGDSLEKAKNVSNSELFQVKNTYLEAIQKKDEFIAEQKDIIEQNDQIQLRLKIIVALMLLLIIAFAFIMYTRQKLRRTLLSKKQTEMDAEHERIENSAVLELKSKELTSYALQLIDKESTVNDLLALIKSEAPKIYKPISIKYKKGTKNLWDEFNMRFTEVNTDFYDRLKAKYPNLSNTEQKHCALIKLNFTAKEMAQILNIASQSVNMSRSRIRKKMGLERSESLSKYISNL